MKIYRLIGILTTLLQEEKVTAPYLADKYEVSRRTINRDIEDLCMAGIPIVTTQGMSGGISLLEGYTLDKQFLTQKELNNILVGLSGLNSVSMDKQYQQIIDKLTIGKDKLQTNPHILVDLSSHYKETLSPKINTISQAIEDYHKISFTYSNKKGKQSIQLDPYFIVFQWSSWYVLGTIDQIHFKLYKLNRMTDLVLDEETFKLVDIPEQCLAFNQIFTDDIKVEVAFDKSETYRLIEEYGESSFVERENDLLFTFSFTNKDYLFSWVLSFGDKAELLKPIEYRKELLEILNISRNKYMKHDS